MRGALNLAIGNERYGKQDDDDRNVNYHLRDERKVQSIAKQWFFEGVGAPAKDAKNAERRYDVPGERKEAAQRFSGLELDHLRKVRSA